MWAGLSQFVKTLNWRKRPTNPPPSKRELSSRHLRTLSQPWLSRGLQAAGPPRRVALPASVTGWADSLYVCFTGPVSPGSLFSIYHTSSFHSLNTSGCPNAALVTKNVSSLSGPPCQGGLKETQGCANAVPEDRTPHRMKLWTVEEGIPAVPTRDLNSTSGPSDATRPLFQSLGAGIKNWGPKRS